MAKSRKMGGKKKEEPKQHVGTSLATKSEMVVKEIDDIWVLAKDEAGHYVTKKSFVGSICLDPYKDYQRRRRDLSEEYLKELLEQ